MARGSIHSDTRSESDHPYRPDFSTQTLRISRVASTAAAIHSRETHSRTEWKL